MTLEVDPERVAEVTARLRRHTDTVDGVKRHLDGLGRRLLLGPEVAPAVDLADRLRERIVIAAALLTRRADRAAQADDQPIAPDGLLTFAGGSVLCSAIQLASPIPAAPSTGGVAGAIDAVGVARDAASLLDAAPSTIAGRGVPLAAIVATVADLALCRLRVGSAAAISTRTIVDEHGQQVYEGSRSQHRNLTDSGEPLAADLMRRDQQMWRVEHSNQLGYLMVPYPGYPAYEVNAPGR